MRAVIATAAAVALCGAAVSSFSPPSSAVRASRMTRRHMFFADAAAEAEVESNDSPASDNIRVAPLDGTDPSIENAAALLVDALWLGSPQQLIMEADGEVSESARSSLIAIQADDLMGKYGERLGKRKLDALLLAATEEGNDKDLLGLVTVEVRLMDKQTDILSSDASEFKLTQAVASLGPKQRREYKDASVIDVANALLPPDISAICSLSNLCVSPDARRRGIAGKLCKEAERLAKEELGFDEMYLRVEAANEAAKKLYEEKLGYERAFEVNSSTALRVDGNLGGFVEVESDILVLKKKI